MAGDVVCDLVERTVLDALIPSGSSDERYGLSRDGRARLARVVDAVFATPSASAALDRLLRVVVALENGMQSPSAAAEIVAVLSASERAARVAERSGDQARAAFARLVGAKRVQVVVDCAGPRVRLRDLIDPGRIATPAQAVRLSRGRSRAGCARVL